MSGTAGSTQQTWAFGNGLRSGAFTRDRSGDHLPFIDELLKAKSVAKPQGALSYALQNSGSSPYRPPQTYDSKLGRKWTPEELAGHVAGTTTPADDSQFYAGGVGLPNWGVSAAKTGASLFGALNGIPSPVTKIANSILGPVLGEEGLNAHTMSNSAIDAGLSLNPVTGLLNMGGKAIASLMGKKFDIANTLGEATGNYSMRSPESLNLELFANDSDSAFGGFNQRTLAEIARQEAVNAEEHAQRQAQEAKLQAAIDADQAAKKVAPLTQVQAQALNQSSSSGGSWNGNSYGEGNHSFTGGSSGGSYSTSPSYGGYSPTMNYSNSSGGYSGSSW